MSETEEDIRRVKSSFGASQSSIPKLQSQVPFNLHDINQHSNSAQFHAQYLQISPELNVANSCKRIGIPPAHPQSPKPSFFSLDSSPLSLYSHRDPISGPTSDQAVGDVSLPPRKTHRRSNSDIPFGFSTILQSSPPLIPSIGSNGFNNPWSKLVKRESNWEKIGCENKNKDEGKGERISEGEVVDDVFSSCINLNNLGTKTNFGGNSDNEATSSIIGNNNMQISGNFCPISDNKKEGIIGGDIAPTIRHYRSVSMDSVMGNMNFVDESINSILAPSPGGQIGNLAVSDSIDANLETFKLKSGNGVFNEAEIKKIMANENLAEMALADPKRVKRILANRQSAARSKERKMRYITELEIKVQTLQTETTSLSAQLMLLQRDSSNLTSQNNELKFRLQAMEQQAQLRDALNDTLTAEVQRLKMMRMELSGDAANFSQLSINPQMFQLQHKQQNGDATRVE